MRLIVCLDDRNGMSFGGRRQSRDNVVSDEILKIIGCGKLWINPYSAVLFHSNASAVCADMNFLDKAKDDDYCFVEIDDITAYMPKVRDLIVMRWNRHYPADLYFPSLNEMHLSFSENFPGNSHEKITKEAYTR